MNKTIHKDSIKAFERLEKGDVIAVVSPSGPVKREKIKKSASVFKRNGFFLKFLPSVFKRDEYLAGSDNERFEDLCEALKNKQYKAVLFSRGGYGSMRLLERLSNIKNMSPKPIFGFSDITALHIFFGRLGWITFHSPNLNGFSELSKRAQRFFFDVITKRVDFREIEFGSGESLRGGVAEGILIGGNLSIISALSGTKFDIDLRGKILFLEDVDEQPYRIDRMLTQILLRKDVRYLRGIVFGHFSNCGREELLIRILLEFANKIKKPVIYGIDSGHIKNNLVLPFNTRCRLNASKGYLSVLERIFL